MPSRTSTTVSVRVSLDGCDDSTHISLMPSQNIDPQIPITLARSTWTQILHALDNSPNHDNYLVRGARQLIRHEISVEHIEPKPIRPSPMIGETGRTR